MCSTHSSPPVWLVQVVQPRRQKRHHFLSICAAGYTLHKHTVPSLLFFCLTLHSFSCLVKEAVLSHYGPFWMISIKMFIDLKAFLPALVYFPKLAHSHTAVRSSGRTLCTRADTHRNKQDAVNGPFVALNSEEHWSFWCVSWCSCHAPVRRGSSKTTRIELGG